MELKGIRAHKWLLPIFVVLSLFSISTPQIQHPQRQPVRTELVAVVRKVRTTRFAYQAERQITFKGDLTSSLLHFENFVSLVIKKNLRHIMRTPMVFALRTLFPEEDIQLLLSPVA